MPAPPRVDVSVFLSSRENLIVEWRPRGMQFERLTPECDWAQWEAAPNRGIAFHTRPSNELLFIHDVSFARRQFPGMYDHQTTTPERVMVDSILLQAAMALAEEIKRRLDLSFEVRMVTDIFTEWEEVESTHWPDGKAHVLASWRIENLEERKKNQELAELEDLKKVCPLEAFAAAWGEADTKKRTGPPPSPESRPRLEKSQTVRSPDDDTLGCAALYGSARPPKARRASSSAARSDEGCPLQEDQAIGMSEDAGPSHFGVSHARYRKAAPKRRKVPRAAFLPRTLEQRQRPSIFRIWKAYVKS
jgi:hypothetical protein